MDFHSKYLKYKLKYLQLKELIGGSPLSTILNSIRVLKNDWKRMETNGFNLTTKMKNPNLGTVKDIATNINQNPNWWLNEGIDDSLKITPVGKLMILDVIKPNIPGLKYRNINNKEIKNYPILTKAIIAELNTPPGKAQEKYNDIKKKADPVNQLDEIYNFFTNDTNTGLIDKDFDKITEYDDFNKIWTALGGKNALEEKDTKVLEKKSTFALEKKDPKLGNKLQLILYEISTNNANIKTSGKFKPVKTHANFQEFLNKIITKQEDYDKLKS